MIVAVIRDCQSHIDDMSHNPKAISEEDKLPVSVCNWHHSNKTLPVHVCMHIQQCRHTSSAKVNQTHPTVFTCLSKACSQSPSPSPIGYPVRSLRQFIITPLRQSPLVDLMAVEAYPFVYGCMSTYYAATSCCTPSACPPSSSFGGSTHRP